MMVKKYFSTTLLIASSLLIGANAAQAQIDAPTNQNTTFGENAQQNANNQNNNVQNGQSNAQTNSQSITYPKIPISPLIQNPVNTENDFGLNFGGAINTLDGSNVTLYLGITYQPGRTDDHNARMAKLKSETALLESQKQTAQTQLELLRKQVAEQEIRLKRLQTPTPTTTPSTGQPMMK